MINNLSEDDGKPARQQTLDKPPRLCAKPSQGHCCFCLSWVMFSAQACMR
jgi:hypothetical protein